MLLYVMRHGPAEDLAPSRRDTDRRLTPGGRAIVQAMAARLQAERGQSLPRILSSPRARARETAAILRAAFGPPEASVELHDELGGDEAIPLELVSALARAGTDALLVGHLPSVEELVTALIHPDPLGFSGFRTATIVALTADGGRFRISSVLDARGVQT